MSNAIMKCKVKDSVFTYRENFIQTTISLLKEMDADKDIVAQKKKPDIILNQA